MNEPLERWGDTAPDFFRDAAALYDQDRPSELEQARMLARVELDALPAGQGAFLLRRLSTKLAAKIVLSVIAIAAFMAGVTLLVQRPSGEVPLPPMQQARPASPPTALEAIRASARIPVDAPGSAREPNVDEAPRKPERALAARNADKKRPPVRAQVAPQDASAELALLVRARRILPADPVRAYALTDEHRASYRDGALREERELLAIEALTALARHDEALTRAAQFSRRFPASVHGRRVTLILQKASP